MNQTLARISKILAGLCLVPLASAGGTIDQVHSRGNKVGVLDPSKPPYVVMTDMQSLQDFRDRLECQHYATRQKAGDCPKYEHLVPFLMDAAAPEKSGQRVAQEVAADLQRLWREFQDRSLYRMKIGIQKSGLGPWMDAPQNMWVSTCFADVVTGVKGIAGVSDHRSTIGPVNVLVPPNTTDVDPPSGMGFQEEDARLEDSDSYLSRMFPKVPPSAYCDNAPSRLLMDDIYFLDWTALFSPAEVQCLYGVCLTIRAVPIVNWEEVRRRVQDACNHAVDTYYPQYVKAVLETLAKRMPFAINWGFTAQTAGKTGVLMQPVAATVDEVDGGRFQKVLDGSDPRLLPYLTLLASQVKADAKFATPLENSLPKTPGVRQLEQHKRWLPPLTPFLQENSGMTTLFQVWFELDTVLEDRPLSFMTYRRWCNSIPPFGATCTVTPEFNLAGNPVLTPAGCTMPSGQGLGLSTFMLPRAKFRFITVPEGYAIPGVVGHPTPLLPFPTLKE